MNKFVSSLLGAFTGTWIAFFVFGIFIFFAGIAMVSSLASVAISSAPSIEDNSILQIDLSGEISETSSNKSLKELINSKGEKEKSLRQILNAIKIATTNNKIKGIYIKCDGASVGVATASAIRNALADFKEKSGKWVYAYGDEITQSDYYIASVADKIYLNPVGDLDLHGLTSQTMFYKGLFDKLGVEMQIIRVGTYKSAVEPYFLTEMSEASRFQTQEFLNNVWKNICDDISASRKVNTSVIQNYADSIGLFLEPEKAVNAKLLDELCYERQFESKLRKLVDISEDDELNFVSPSQVAESETTTTSDSNGHIAVIYAEGEISDSGKGINSSELVPQIVKLANDKDVKGLVLRVNSPGGSAFASEQIWDALNFFKSKKKPFAVSMGDYAASGGYYISSGADKIFADKSTITGSIGIFGVVPNFKKLANDKLGLTTDFVSTAANSNMTIFEPLTPVQREAVQRSVNRGYELFVSRCATGRKKTTEQIKAIAEGRVWDGVSAKKIGLVDELGGIDDAIKWVAAKANLKSNCEARVYPEFKPDFINLLYNTMQNSASLSLQNSNNYELAKFIDSVQQILQRDRIQCRMPEIYIY